MIKPNNSHLTGGEKRIYIFYWTPRIELSERPVPESAWLRLQILVRLRTTEGLEGFGLASSYTAIEPLVTR